MNPLRILVADDHEIVRRGGLVLLLKSHAGWDVCGEAQDGREAVDKAKALRPDIIILDIGLPNLPPNAAPQSTVKGAHLDDHRRR